MFKSPNSKTISSAAIVVGSAVVGAKLSDGVVAIIPDSAQKYSKAIVLAAAVLGAASVDAKTTAGTAVQSTFVGMAVKQGADMLTEAIKPTISAKDPSTLLGKFQNAFIGHTDTDIAVQTIASTETERYQLSSPYEMVEEVMQSPGKQLGI